MRRREWVLTAPFCNSANTTSRWPLAAAMWRPGERAKKEVQSWVGRRPPRAAAGKERAIGMPCPPKSSHVTPRESHVLMGTPPLRSLVTSSMSP